MSYSGVENAQNSRMPLYSGLIAFLAVSAITLLVVGILGTYGVIHMAPIGGELMIYISMGLIAGMIAGVAKLCCKKD